MTANYYLRKLSVDPEDDRWSLVTHTDNAVNERFGRLSDLAKTLENTPVIALINAAHVRVVRTKVPGRSEAQAKQAAPYVIEEDLINEVDELRIHVSKTDNQGDRLITAYEGQAIEDIWQQFGELGIELSALTPDASLIASARQSLTAIQAHDCVMFGYHDGLYASVDYELFPLLLARLIRDENLTDISIVKTSDAKISAQYNEQLRDQLSSEGTNLTIQLEDTADPALSCILSRLHPAFAADSVVNLLPDSVRNKDALGISSTKAYLLAAGLAAIALLGHIGFSWSYNQSAAQELAALQLQQQNIFRDGFPEISRVVNAEAQAQQRLKELKELGPPPAEFLGVLHASTTFLEQNNTQELQLTGFSFADGVLLLRTESKDMALLERYRSELNGFLTAEVVNAESGDNGVSGAIRVRKKQ